MHRIKQISLLLLWAVILNYFAFTVLFSPRFSAVIFISLCIVFLASLFFVPRDKTFSKKISRLEKGNMLLISFIVTVLAEIAVTVVMIVKHSSVGIRNIVLHCIIVILIESIIFWYGIIIVYINSVQLGIKWRVLGIALGLVPVANIIMLVKIIRLTTREVKYEKQKEILLNTRAESEICKTKYPVLLIHGVFFRDTNFFNYWGRIPQYLKRNGATIYYGEHQSAASVKDSGIEIAQRIKSITEKTGCEKVNIIAHSKGGLDARYAISCAGAGEQVASLTTINTPHKGCLFAEKLLKISPQKFKSFVADKYNIVAKTLGDKKPDFIDAVTDLTSSACEEFNRNTPDLDSVYYQSVGSKMNKASSGRFPLNVVYPLVKHYDGDNDGLVCEDSMKYGEKFTFITVSSGRGVSHADMVDLNRENISGFDVRELYAQILSELKKKGL